MTKVCVVIPMYGMEEFTRKCIHMTRNNAGMPVDIIVVDDGSPEAFESQYARVIKLEKNLGFTGAINAGILQAMKDGYEFIHILNNDTEPYPDFIKILYDWMQKDKEIGIAQSSRKYVTDSEFCIELYSTDLIRGGQTVSTESAPLPDIVFPPSWVPLCSALLRTSMLFEIGIFDKHMITWASDNDLCLRARFADWKVALVPASRVLHYHQQTTGPTPDGDPRVAYDQKVFIEKISGFQYAKLMSEVPLDSEKKLYGQIHFDMVKK